MLLAGLFALLTIANVHEEVYPQAQISGIPLIITEYSDLTKLSIDQILTTHDTVFVLYDEHRGIVQAFDKAGTYRYTASFFKHANGTFRMAVQDGQLYVRDCIHNIYVLQDGALIEFYERDLVPEWICQLDYQLSSPNYRVRMGSVWDVADADAHCFIRRSIVSTLYQNNFIFFLAISAIVIAGLLKCRRIHIV